MKSVTTLLAAIIGCVLFTCGLSAQNYFTREYSAPGFAQSANHINCYDGGYLILNQYQNLSSQQEWIAVIKTDSAGTIQWTKTIGPVYPSIQDVAQTTDSCYVFCYVEFSGARYNIVKLDQQGNLIYSNFLNGTSTYQVICNPQIRARNGGGYYVAGDLHNTVTNTTRWQLMEFDAGGNLLWTHCYYESFSNKTPHVDFDTCSNGDLVLLGTHWDSTGHSPMVLRIAPGGNLIWAYWYQSMTNSTYLYSTSIVAHTNGQLSIIAYFMNTQSTRYETIAIQTDANGSELWSLSFGATINVLGMDASSVENSSTVVYFGHPKKGGPGVLFKFDTAGYVLAGRKYENHIYGMSQVNNDYLFSGINTTNGRVTHYTTDQNGAGCNDTALAITKTSVPVIKYIGIDDTVIQMVIGNTNVPIASPGIYLFNICEGTSIAEQNESTPSIYPSPASDFIQINCQDEIQQYDILDLQGNIVRQKNCSSSNEVVDIRTLAMGVYFVQVYTDEKLFTKKIIVTR